MRGEEGRLIGGGFRGRGGGALQANEFRAGASRERGESMRGEEGGSGGGGHFKPTSFEPGESMRGEEGRLIGGGFRGRGGGTSSQPVSSGGRV